MVEFLLVMMPGVLSMIVWRKLHSEQHFSAFDYLECVIAFDFAVLLFNVSIIWSRGWEAFNFAGFGSIGTMKYTITSAVFAVGLPLLLCRLLRTKKNAKLL